MYFIEMNTAHTGREPVTALVTGSGLLIKRQNPDCAGETKEDAGEIHHPVMHECRINAEDPGVLTVVP